MMTDDTTFDAVKDRLRLQMFDATELGILEVSTLAAEMPKVQFVAAELYVGVRIDDVFVTTAQADAWDVPFSDAIVAALASTPPLQLGEQQKTLEVTDEEQAAAILVDPSRAQALGVLGDMAVIPLAQTLTVITGTDDEQGFAKALDAADELLASGARLASIHPIGSRGGRWFPFPWRERFPALSARIRRATREFGVRAYEEQGAALDAGDVRVLTPTLDTLDSGVTVTVATWLSGTAALLPVVDNVIVASRKGRSGVMGFAQFIEQAGDTVVRTELAPIRYYVPASLKMKP